MKPTLNENDYRQMQATMHGVLHHAIKNGADHLTLAHAVAPMAVELLLQFHPADAVREIFAKQVEIIAAHADAQAETCH